MKKKLIVLIAIGLVLLVLGCVFNFRQGLMMNDDFWKIHRDGSYTHGKDSVLCTPVEGGIHFDITLNSKDFTADLTETDSGSRMEFSDGWAIELLPWDVAPKVIDGVLVHSDYTIIPLDFDAMGCRFEKAMPEVTEPFYDENGRQLGTWHSLTTASGEIIESWETWNDPEAQTAADIAGGYRRTVQTIREGEPLASSQWSYDLIVNEDGAYLMNPEILFGIPTGYHESLSRANFARRLTEMADGSAEMRGHISCIFMFLLFYAAGTVQLLWPEEIAFYGSRWKYRNEPELSDEGIAAAKFGAAVMLVIAAVMLFIPAFA